MKERLSERLRYKNLLTKKFLEKEYLQKKKSISQLQKELKIDWGTIKYYLNLHKILLRTHKEQASISSPGGKPKYDSVLSKDFIIKEYIKKKRSILELCKELNVDYGTVRRYLKKYNILIRSNQLQRRINNPSKEFIIDEYVKSFIDSLLLGDASIPKRKNGLAPRSLTQACKHKEYLEYIKKRFFKMNILCSPILSRWIKDDRCKNKGYNQHFLQTRRYKTFELFRGRFYPKGKKIIPRDIILTKELLLQFYLCDGNFYREIKLCTDGFTKKDVLFLKQLIEKKLNIRLRIHKNKDNYELAINKSNTEKFLNYIGDCPVRCYEHKWKDNESERSKERKRLKARMRYHNNKNGYICNTFS